MIESQYTKNVNKKLPPNIYQWKIRDDFNIGVADSYYNDESNQSRALWVEYKLIKALPKRDTTFIVPNLSDKQLQFLTKMQNAGEKVAIIVGVEHVPNCRGAMGIVMALEEAEGIRCDLAKERLKDYIGISTFIYNSLK